MRKLVRWTVAFVVVAAVISVLLVADSLMPPLVTPFYTPPDPLAAGKPGDILRYEAWPAPPGMRGWRILYRSTALDGQDIAVSGTLFAPDRPAPTNGFPLITVAHGTSGIGRACAPSLLMSPNRTTFPDMFQSEVRPFVEAGYAVVLSDLQGMGAPGPYSYLVGEVEGRNVLDAARAAKQFPSLPLQEPVLIVGHSQGGHGAAFAGQLAAAYAPELVVPGVALIAPAAELSELVGSMLGSDQKGANTALAMMVAGAWSSAYPDLRADQLLTEPGLGMLSHIYTQCTFGAVQSFSRELPSLYFKANPAATAPWSSYIEANTPGHAKTFAPLFVMQGSADNIILPETTERFVQRLCQQDNTVFYQEYPGATHFTVVQPAIPELLVWLADRLAGKAAPDNCP